MGVGARATCDTTSDAPTRRADLVSGEADLRALLVELKGSAQIVAGASVCLTDRGPVVRHGEQPGSWPHDELARCLWRGENGDPSNARRAAELLELIEDYEGAEAWWHRAAELGDGDAIDYVRVILGA